MIAFLQGKLISLHPESNECTLLAGEIGYELHMPKRTFEKLELNHFVSVWIHTHVREDQLVLFAFLTEMEKQFFRVLLGVQGLGPKTALALLSEHGVERLTQLTLSKNTTEIATAPGVGKKLAERLVLELATKLEKISWLSHIQKVASQTKSLIPSVKNQLREDLNSALLNLGYQPNQIKVSLDRLLEREGIEKHGFEILLRHALKEMSGRTITSNAPIEVGGHG